MSKIFYLGFECRKGGCKNTIDKHQKKYIIIIMSSEMQLTKTQQELETKIVKQIADLRDRRAERLTNQRWQQTLLLGGTLVLTALSSSPLIFLLGLGAAAVNRYRLFHENGLKIFEKENELANVYAPKDRSLDWEDERFYRDSAINTLHNNGMSSIHDEAWKSFKKFIGLE
jgi:hypothetical protein